MNQQNTQTQQILQDKWSKMVPKKFVIPYQRFVLSNQQVKFIISGGFDHEQQMQSDHTTFLTPEQTVSVQSFIQQSPEQSVFLKLNNRTPKDLNPFLQKIHNIDDLTTVLQTSEYLIEEIQQITNNHQSCFIFQIRQFDKDIQNHLHHYEIYVRGGVTLAIVQRFMDHIGEQPTQSQIQIILQIIQVILSAITLSAPPSNPNEQVNCFLCKIFIKGNNKCKILGIHKFPYTNNSPSSLISSEQLHNFYNQTVLPSLQGSPLQPYQNSIYETNQNIKPLIRVLTDEAMLKKYDMGEYQMGNQIADENMLTQWKQFIQEAEHQIKK